jgi:hypothetical protein
MQQYRAQASAHQHISIDSSSANHEHLRKQQTSSLQTGRRFSKQQIRAYASAWTTTGQAAAPTLNLSQQQTSSLQTDRQSSVQPIGHIFQRTNINRAGSSANLQPQPAADQQPVDR